MTPHPTPLQTLLHQLHPLPPKVAQELEAAFTYQELPRNFVLLRQGAVCNTLWLLAGGAARAFYVDAEGRERNTWFSFDQDALTDAFSLGSGHPATETIQLLEDSQVYAIAYPDLKALCRKHHAFALWYIDLIEQVYVPQIEERVNDLQFLTARQRYEKLLLTRPGITNRVSLGHIASYLNITQETLSRIRSGKV